MPGCSNSSSANPVNEPQARDALKIALDAWKKGETSQSLASSSTPMTVQDFEWDTGAKLIDYQLVDDGKGGWPQPPCPGKAHHDRRTGQREKEAKPAEKKASYVVGTSPR